MNDNTKYRKILLVGVVLIAVSIAYTLIIRVVVDKYFVEIDYALVSQELTEYAKSNKIENNETIELNPDLFHWPLKANIIYYLLLFSFWFGSGFLINKTIKKNKPIIFLVPLIPSMVFIDFLYPVYVAFCYLGATFEVKNTNSIVKS